SRPGSTRRPRSACIRAGTSPRSRPWTRDRIARRSDGNRQRPVVPVHGARLARRSRGFSVCWPARRQARDRMDIVFIEGLRIETIIGLYDWERRTRQPVVLDLELAFDNARAAAT